MNEATFQTANSEARAREDWSMIRIAAVEYLRKRGAPEIGSSDINCAVWELYRMFEGDWVAICIEYAVEAVLAGGEA